MKKIKISFICKRKLKRLSRRKIVIPPSYIKFDLADNRSIFKIGTYKLNYLADEVVFVRNELLSIFKKTLSKKNFEICKDLIYNNNGECYIWEHDNTENKILRDDVSIFFVFDSERNFLKAKMKS